MSKHKYLVDVLVPGFIEASSGVQFGEPCLKGTRFPFSIGLGWLWEYLDKPDELKEMRLTRDQVIVLAGFHAGFEWHRGRKRRKAMWDAVDRLWEQINSEAEGDGG